MRQGARAIPAVIGLSVVGTVLGLVGCSGSDPAATGPTTPHPGTAPPTTSASATPTQDPGQAAIAAVQRMFDAYNAMLKSGSSTAYRATFTKDCSIRISDALVVERVFQRRESVNGGAYKLSGLRVVDHYPEHNLVVVQGDVTQAAATILKSGRVVDHFDASGTASAAWNVSEVNGIWLVSKGSVLA